MSLQLTTAHQAAFDEIQDAWVAYRGALHDALKIQDNPASFTVADAEAASDAHQQAAAVLAAKFASFPGGAFASFAETTTLPSLYLFRP